MMFPRLNNMFRFLLPQTVRAHRIMGGPLRGSRIVTSWRDYPAAILGITEPQLLQWFAATVKPGETWLDVGAHYGYTAIALSRQVGPTGRVFAFEPMLTTAGHLVRTRQLNGFPQLTVVPLALGATARSFELQQLTTIRGMIDSTLATDGADPMPRVGWQETILTCRFDDLWPGLCGKNARIDGIKIDVQGMEIEAVRGMSAQLQAHKPKLVIEVHRGVSREELLGLLARLGYRRPAVPIEPVAGEVEPRYLDNRSYAFSAD
jgi:FkbM family methyltransferase